MAHPLSVALRAFARDAPNAPALIALAGAVDVDGGDASCAEALGWFDATVRLTDGRYAPCAPVRRRLRALSGAESPGDVIAALTADELATRAVLRERGAEGDGSPSAPTEPFARWTARRRAGPSAQG